MTALARALPLMCILLWVLPAAGEVEVTLESSAETIEVGQTVVVQAKAMNDGDAPTGPELRVPSGFVQHGPSIGTNHQVSFVNGRIQRLSGITATWELTARRAGEFTIGPATVAGPDGRLASQTLRVKVVPAGSLPATPPAQRRRRPFDDDLFGTGRQQWLDELLGRARGLPDAPAEYQLARAPDRDAFLHAELSQDSAVVGEQVTLSIYAYGGRGNYHEGNSREPRKPDFYSYALVENSARQRVYSAQIDGRNYQAVLVRKFALFPLEAGTLEIGPMEMTFIGPGYRARGAADGFVRTSPRLTLEVTEAPEAGRPQGYQPGDVGSYRLQAQVAPTQLKAGESLSVTATLEGRGNVPSRLLTPEQKGVRWLEPTITEDIRIDQRGHVRGSRTFTYIVQVDRAGKLDLGVLRLPYYDAQRKRYQIAKAVLGDVLVEEAPPAASQPEAETTEVASSRLMAPKTELGSRPASLAPLASRPWFWWTVLGMPLAVALLGGASTTLARWLQRGRIRRESPNQRSAEAWAHARAETKQGNLKAACSAIERAVFLGIEDKTGIKGRALLREELGQKLVELGYPEATARELQEVLTAIDELRFGQQQSGAEQLITRGQKALKQLDGERRGGR